MAAGFAELRPDSTGKKVQANMNTISAETVYAQFATPVADPSPYSSSFMSVSEGTGKKMQTFLLSSNHFLAIVPVDASGSPL